MTTLGKIDSVMIWTDNPGKLRAFYGDKLGLEKSMEEGDFVAYKLPQGEAQIVVGPHSEVHGQTKEPNRVMVNFAVDDCKKSYEELKGRGVEFTKEPTPEPDGPVTIATFRDPDGNTLQLFEMTGRM